MKSINNTAKKQAKEILNSLLDEANKDINFDLNNYWEDEQPYIRASDYKNKRFYLIEVMRKRNLPEDIQLEVLKIA